MQKSGCNRLIVELPGVSAGHGGRHHAPGGADVLRAAAGGCAGCGHGGSDRLVPQGRVGYKPGTCEPDVAEDGTVAVIKPDGTLGREAPTFTDATSYFSSIGSVEPIVWTPAQGDLNGRRSR